MCLPVCARLLGRALHELERARGGGPSGQVVSALADALRLDADERGHLFQLVGRDTPRDVEPSTEVTPSVAELVHKLDTTAAIVLSARFDVLAWNALAATLMEDFGALAPTERNMIKRLDHPELGRLTLACDALLDPHRDQNVVMFSIVSAAAPVPISV